MKEDTMKFYKSIKFQLIAFLSIFALYLSIIDKDALFLLSTLLAIVTAVITDSVILSIKKKKPQVTESSIITGLIIGFVLYSQQPLYLVAVASLLAIISKHVIRFNNRHIFNPATLGILLTVIILQASTQWKGTYLWYILVPAGSYFAYRFRKLMLLASYGIMALSLFAIQALQQHVPVIDIFGYLSYFFIFIMFIEPKTSPITPLGMILFGIIVATSIFILTQIGVHFDAELCGLLIGNATFPWLNTLKPKAKGGTS
jgi:Na+-translocating ferredoxin:NAD+ oxidoreductase RnfD subunit